MPSRNPALWPASACPATVILDTAPIGCADATPLVVAAWPIILADRFLSDGRHMVLADTDAPHHIWLRDTLPHQPLAYVIVRDAAIEKRRHAAWRLDRRLAGAPPSRRADGCRPTPFQRNRLNLLLDIIDMLHAPVDRPTSHEIARRLIYPGMTIGRGMEWKTSTQRRRTQRLIDEAHALMKSGYRALLRGETGGATKAGTAK